MAVNHRIVGRNSIIVMLMSFLMALLHFLFVQKIVVERA